MPKQSQSVRTPSLDLEVSVRHADPGLVVPPELTAFVIASYVDERLDDWLLTNDAIAFGSDTVVQAFHRWRATWEVRWTLDSISSVERLLAIASTEPDLVDNAVVATLEPILAEVRDGMTGLVGPNAAADLAAAVGELRDAVRNRNLVGVGFVNATPGYEGTGLARAWSGSGGREVIAADHAMEVVLDPETGLGIELFLMGGRRATTIHLVEVEHDHALVHYLDDDVTLPTPRLEYTSTWQSKGALRAKRGKKRRGSIVAVSSRE